MKAITIGTWHEPEARDISHCPSYYAADHETLRVVPGDYPVRLTFQGGYTIPMPYWLLIGIDTHRVSGRLYSGFGGVNFAHTDLPAGEEVEHTLQLYDYMLRDLVRDGRVTLSPEWAWLVDPNHQYAHQNPNCPQSWDDSRLTERSAQ